jgi:hypothetical protein
MPTPTRRPEHEERDLIDAIPGFDRVSTNLQRSVGPSCFLSLIISALVIVIVRRYTKLPLPGMVILSFVIWWATLVILVRLGGSNSDDE